MATCLRRIGLLCVLIVCLFSAIDLRTAQAQGSTYYRTTSGPIYEIMLSLPVGYGVNPLGSSGDYRSVTVRVTMPNSITLGTPFDIVIEILPQQYELTGRLEAWPLAMTPITLTLRDDSAMMAGVPRQEAYTDSGGWMRVTQPNNGAIGVSTFVAWAAMTAVGSIPIFGDIITAPDHIGSVIEQIESNLVLSDSELLLAYDYENLFDSYVIPYYRGAGTSTAVRFSIPVQVTRLEMMRLVIGSLALSNAYQGVGGNTIASATLSGGLTIDLDLENGYSTTSSGSSGGDQREERFAGTINVGQSVTGSLTEGTRDAWTLVVQGGQAIQINMDAGFDTYLELYGPDGREIARNDDYNGLNSQINVTLPGAGMYTIIARAFSSSRGGPYTLGVLSGGGGSTSSGGSTTSDTQVNTAGSISFGQTLSATLIDETRDAWTLVAQGGEMIQINMDADFDTYLELYGPDGREIDRNDDHNGLDSQINVVLPGAGTYTIIARSFGDFSGGPYTLGVQLDMDDSTTTTAGGAQARIVGAISVGQTLTGMLIDGTRDAWTMVGQNGQAIQINMDADFDTYLELYGPNGVEIARNDDHDGLDSQITVTLPGAGTYTIIARSFADFSGGPYTLSVR